MAGSFPELVQLVLQRFDLRLNLLEGGALGGDEQPAILASDVTRKGYLDADRTIRGAVLIVEFEGSEEVHRWPPFDLSRR
jgi:hypothetical protein